MTTALVLAGGGAKGSFQVGALQYMYEKGFCADVICSTSVGSVNGLQLAHGGTPATQDAAFNKLKSIWETLKFNQHMYEEAAWLKTVDAKTREDISRLLGSGLKIDWEPVAGAAGVFGPHVGLLVGAGVLADLIERGVDIVNAAEKFETATSLFTLDPIRKLINDNLVPGDVSASGVELRLVAASLDSGAIHYITQDGAVIETDGRPVDPTLCVTERNNYNGAMAEKLKASKAVSLAERDKRSDAAIDYEEASRAAAQAKEALDRCVNSAPVAQPLTVKLVDGTIASATIPVAFPPVTLGNEAYVDGGVRWQLPLQAAIDLDAQRIVAINTSVSGIQPAKQPFRNANMFAIGERVALGLELWETQESHWRAARLQVEQRGRQLWMITPRVEVHDTFTVDSGLIDINIAYGYMCAADLLLALYPLPAGSTGAIAGPGVGTGGGGALVGVGGGAGASPVTGRPTSTAPAVSWVDAADDPDQAKLVDGIALCRRRCWELEHQVFGFRIPLDQFSPKTQRVARTNPNVLHELRGLKTFLGLMVLARQQAGRPLPPGALSWGDEWERHRWARADTPRAGANPWAAFAAPKQTARPVIPQPADPSKPPTVPAATKAAGMLARSSEVSEVWLIEESRPYRRRVPNVATLQTLGGPAAVKTIPRELLEVLAQGSDYPSV